MKWYTMHPHTLLKGKDTQEDLWMMLVGSKRPHESYSKPAQEVAEEEKENKRGNSKQQV